MSKMSKIFKYGAALVVGFGISLSPIQAAECLPNAQIVNLEEFIKESNPNDKFQVVKEDNIFVTKLLWTLFIEAFGPPPAELVDGDTENISQFAVVKFADLTAKVKINMYDETGCFVISISLPGELAAEFISKAYGTEVKEEAPESDA